MIQYPLSYSFRDEIYTPDQAIDKFLAWVTEQEKELYPAQEEAILELYNGKNVILNTPTGSGKSLVATALHYLSLTSRRRSVYTSPVKALVNEKFFALCRDFGPHLVGLLTGDAAVNREAPILCCTAEILANMALRKGADVPVQDVIMDEFHYYADRDRGIAWQLPLLTMKKSRFLLMSATFGATEFIEKELKKLTGLQTVLVRSVERPVPLEFQYSEDPLDQTVTSLMEAGKAPIYIVNFSQREAAQVAQSFLSLNFCPKEQKARIAEEIAEYRFGSPYGKEMKTFLRHGVGLHHAGLLPKYRILVESLAQKGLLKIISGTDTLGVGVNIPIRTVLFTRLCKFDGQKTGILTARDFHQISGRAGRKGFDVKGFVTVQAPEHVIENKKLEKKALLNPRKKFVKAKPPEKGFVPWTEETFRKLLDSDPEPLRSSFQISHGMLLNVLSRTSDGCGAMRQVLRDCHESDAAKVHLHKRAFQLFRALVQKKVVDIIPVADRFDERKVKVNVDLQEDFSMDQTLSLFLLDALVFLDPFEETYPLQLLSLVESILENPTLILARQLEKIKSEKLAELKLQGMDYEDRLNELEKLEYPKPMADFIYGHFNNFITKHPWVEQENIRPKSIAREIYEHHFSFSEYAREYKLERAEGILLRYISDTYKALSQTVPHSVKNDAIDDMTKFFETMLKETDSSLVDEWKKLQELKVNV
ncbi:MAG: DUF3516 domain-containing protein [Deltaproteobacteria bacterium]|nr:DUF3516 domain-containing protein [Deltaproteobacteria bacterium]